jgi:hypothetical protein
MNNVVLPPEGLSGQELVEWAEDQNLRDKDREVTLPEMSGIDPEKAVKLGFLHVVFPPEMGVSTDDYIALWKYLWFACQDPNRPVDEAMLLDDNCPRCQAEWDRRGLPVANLPKITLSTPIMRGPTRTQ